MKSKINLILLITFILGISFSRIVLAAPEDVSVYELPSLITESEGIGYSVYRFNLQNNTNKKQTVDIELQNKNSYDNSEGFIVTKQVELSAGEDREEKIFIPNTSTRNETEVYFSIRREIIKKLSPKTGLSVSKGYFYDATHILLDRKISNLEADKLFKDPGLEYRTREKYKTYYFESNLDMLDKDWLSYSQFDNILFYNDTFEEIPVNIQKAILDYVRVGGHLMILGEFKNADLLNDINNNEKKEKKDIVKENNKSEKNELSKAINTFDSFLKPQPRRNMNVSKYGNGSYSSSGNEDGLINYKSFGLGRITFLRKDIFELIKVTPPEEESSTSSTYGGYRSNKSKDDSKSKKTSKIDNTGKIYVPKKVLSNFDFHRKINFSKDGFSAFKLADSYKSLYQAVGGSPLFLAVLVLIFALLLGPINLFVLHKYNMKILVFLTVPVISMICCSILFLYFLLFEYGRLDYFRQSFTILDENSNTSYTLGGGILVAGRNLNNELVFPLSSVVYPSSMSWRDKALNISNKYIKLDKAQNFTYNWIKAKSPFSFTVTSIKQDRSRLEIKKSGNELELLNGLGANIGLVYILSDDGKTLYLAKNIRAGANGKAELYKNLDYKRKTTDISYPQLFSKYNDEKQVDGVLSDYALRTLKNGEYIAWLTKDPFLKQGLEYKANVHELGCFVHGISEFGGSR